MVDKLSVLYLNDTCILLCVYNMIYGEVPRSFAIYFFIKYLFSVVFYIFPASNV